MSVVDPTHAVFDLVRSSKNRILIVAPYIKSSTMKILTDSIPESVSDFCCVTRWLPQDIASGVCDIEIFDHVMECGGKLRIHPRLHAKFYSNSVQCLIGSSNLTGRGLGQYVLSNIELLVALPCDFPGVAEWEANLLESSTLVTNSLRNQTLQRVEQIKRAGSILQFPEIKNLDNLQLGMWMPTCPNPDYLWIVYQGRGADSLPSTAYESAKADLSVFSPADGLTHTEFKDYIAALLLQIPAFYEIDKLAHVGVTDSSAHQFLVERLNVDERYVDRTWVTLKTWILAFFGESFRLQSSEEVLIKGAEITRRN